MICAERVTATLTGIYRFPVKGLAGEALETVDVGAGEGLPHDRRFALARTAPPDAAPFPWRPKQRFATLMRDAELARLTCRVDYDRGTIEIGIPDQAPCVAPFASAEGRARIDAYLRGFVRSANVLHFVECGRLSFTDVPENCLSLINRASIEELGTRVGAVLHPLRFRANLYVGGLPPWSEFDWIGNEIRVGGVRLRVHSRIPRCAAPAVDPETGERDVNVVKALKTHYGHIDMGIYAEVIDRGRLAVGDAVSPPQDVVSRSRFGHELRFLRFLARSARIFFRGS